MDIWKTTLVILFKKKFQYDFSEKPKPVDN
jgi:hypothetical protein